MNTTTGGVRCHNPEACCAGQKPCPSPGACGVAAPAPPGPSAHWKFNGLYADTEVRSVADDRLLAVIHAGPERARIVSLLKAAPQPNAALADGWISVDDRLPEPGKAVLLDIGLKTPIRAMWASKHSVEAGDECPDAWAEYDEGSDTYYCPEGWYEWNQYEETHWAVSRAAVAWMALPAPPTLNASKERHE